jgi:3-oxoacyl-[acyl-carrier protein] reductase
MQLDIAGKVALVSGASSGIGMGISRVLAGEGVQLAITARKAEPLQRIADEIEDACGRRPLVVTGDVTLVADISRIVGETTQSLGPIDILVNCAGGSRPLSPDAGDSEWDEAFLLNFTSMRRMAGEVIASMRLRKWGRIINISGSMEPRSINAASAAKAALHLWAKGLASDVAADGVTVNTIPPGRINSDQILNRLHPTPEARTDFIDRNIPIGYFGEPEDIGHLVAFLASPLARYITGAVIPVDGGMRYSPH